MGNSNSPPSSPPPSSSSSVEELESSINHLLTSWRRRQRWQHLTSTSPPHPTNRAQWRTNLAAFLDSLPVHLAVALLLLLDLVLTVLDLSSSILSCSTQSIQRKGIKHEVYHWTGVAILSLLSAKVFALVLALGGSFFSRAGYVVDAVVVVGALVVEVTAEGLGAGLLVAVSLWRVVRVVESVFELSSEAIESQIEGIEKRFDELAGENRQLEEAVRERDEVIMELAKGEAADPSRFHVQ